MTLRRSSSERNLASSGKSWTIQYEAKESRMVKRPSKMKIQAQPGLPPTPSKLAIAAASRPPKLPARAAAEKKMARRMPNSFLLYQHDNQYDTPGKRPASVRPRNHRAVNSPPLLWTRPMVVMQIPQSIMIVGMKIEGLNFFSMICVKGSKQEYEICGLVRSRVRVEIRREG